MTREANISSYVGQVLGETFGRFRQFRRRHLLSSEHHICANNIRASEKGIFQRVNLSYGSGSVYSLKVDDSIPEFLTKSADFSYPTCNSDTLARRYCIGLFQRHLQDLYKGEIICTGINVDPYDQVFIADKRSDMWGMVGVEQVVDIFTPETGWISEITPDMIVEHSDYSAMATRDALMSVYSQLYHRINSTERGRNIFAATVATAATVTAAGAVLTLGSNLIGTGIGLAMADAGLYWITQWTQDRQPISIIPLIIGNRPFVVGLDSFRNDSIFVAIRGQLHAAIDNLHEGWRALHLGDYGNDLSISVAQGIGGQSGIGLGSS
jgi:hypothetical protein